MARDWLAGRGSEMTVTEMIALEAGSFAMGSEKFYADEGPVHFATVSAFEIDIHPVTNAQFAEFVDATGYVTVAERTIDPRDFPGMDPADAVPGALVFRRTDGPVDLANWRQWWAWVPGASWRHPYGPDSTNDPAHPVVQVSFDDAQAYAAWVDRRLPTEAEWEFAARAGLDGATYAWGEELHPEGRLMANTWQGSFPWRNTGALGWAGTSPVGSFPPNGFGLFDMIGNVWEWTTDAYFPEHRTMEGTSCSCGPGTSERQADSDRLVLKGGSHLCAPEYCLRYRPAARSPQSIDTATTHIGFRCVRSL
ncbi:formylglycine-generating enzyme family protein [soil metagenome]